MRKHFVIRITTVLVLAAAIFGFSFRGSYTNITGEEGYLDMLAVAEMPEAICISSCERMKESLPNAPIIIRVTPTEDVEHQFGQSHQKVRVEQVFHGDGLSTGDNIYITAVRWRVVINQEHKTLERGFVNVLQQDHDYLVFLSESTGLTNNNLPVYCLFEESLISPVFAYDQFCNTVVVTTGGSTYVPYCSVSQNEFFATSEDCISAWLQVKHLLLDMYPIQ